MIERKTWEEFQNTGLLFYINQILHVFGWAIVVEMYNGAFVNAYPARVKFRGFGQESIDKGYAKVTRYLKENIDELEKETEPLEDE